MPHQPNKKTSLRSLLIVFLLLVVSLSVLAVNGQSVKDWMVLRNYTAPAEIATIATQDSLTDQARKIFYVNHPLVEEKAAFTASCPGSSREQTIVLGCYQSNQSGIFLLNVTDSRLNGVKQVTAAHEMLHAAYDRLSDSERTRVNTLLLAYYNNDLKDDRISKTIDAYKKSEPSELVNEMHSIFGTEIVSLPPALEQYYKQYFTNRSQVVAFSTQYQGEFTSRQAQVTAADAQLASLRVQIDSNEADLKTQQGEISAKQASLVSLRNSGDVAAYNAGVPAYNSMIDSYNRQVQTVRGLVNQYNQVVTTRNAIAVEEDQLVKSLSADVSTINN